MARKIVECVPNFSEGRDPEKIKEITDAIVAAPGVTLLDVDPGADTNRTVVTFIGDPDTVAEAAFRAIKCATEVIDMRTHHGAHPRLGATDVCPFVPVDGVTMEECVQIAHQVGERVGRELGIPIYFYQAAASTHARRDLANIRRGEYERLPEKIHDPAWKPDCGPAEFNAKSGATVIGAREFLIAYNINLNTPETRYATDIAFELRQKGRVARRGNIQPFYFKGDIIRYQADAFPCGNCEFDAKSVDELRTHYRELHAVDFNLLCQWHDYGEQELVGRPALRAGHFDYCQAIGWYVDQYKRAQISINLTNYQVTPPHLVLEKARELAAERGLVVTGSEIVGVIPFQALYQAGAHYMKQQGRSYGVPALDVCTTAVQSMGLNDVRPLNIHQVLGLPRRSPNALAEKTLAAFADEVSRSTPTPGGGSVAALAGALGAALASMATNLAQGKAESESKDASLIAMAVRAQQLKDALISAVDEDAEAFQAYLDARRMPQTTLEEKAVRRQKMQEGLKQAVRVPYQTAERSYEAMQVAQQSALHGSIGSITDAAVGAQITFAGVRGGVLNVLTNLPDITDQDFNADLRAKCSALIEKAQTLLNDVNAYVDQKLEEKRRYMETRR